jgi:peptidoglycan/LPS O-acetylase OafA/YrhL
MPSIHFIRTIFSILIFFAHKAFEEFFYPLNDRTSMMTFMTSSLMTLFRASFIYTEVFIMISGFLVAHSLIGKLQRGRRINIIKEIFGRYFRLMPPVLMLILFTTFILPLMGRGPLWTMLIDRQAEICKRTAWWNVFMVQNLMGIEQICIMNTHHVATDYQLSVTAPFLVILLYWYPVATGIGISALAVISAIGRFIVTYLLDLSLFIGAEME